jgi:hypothetical protein
MENIILEYLDPPEQVAARLKEKHRPGAKIAVRELGNLKKAEQERRAALHDVNQKYPNRVPCNCRLQYEAISSGDDAVDIVQDRLSRWDRLSAEDVRHVMGTFPTDINRVTVLDNDLAFGFALANKAGTVRENIKNLYTQLEFEEAEKKRIGPQDETWTIPTMAPARQETPVEVRTDFRTLKP